MAFEFKPHPTATGDAARVAYIMPDLPAGISWKLHDAIDTYRKAVINGPDGADEAAFEKVKAFKAATVSDVIAKVLFRLHFDHRGLADDGTLVITAEHDEEMAAIQTAQTLLCELYAQVPSDWDLAMREYRAAALAEQDFDRLVWTPGYEAKQAGETGNSDEVEKEMERLMDIRGSAESVLMDIPAPTLAEFAVKYLICFDCDRDMNGYEPLLLAEAKRLIGVADDPSRNYIEAILAVTNWRETGQNPTKVATLQAESEEV